MGNWWSTWGAWPVNATALTGAPPPAVYLLCTHDGGLQPALTGILGVYSSLERATDARARYPYPLLTEIIQPLTMDADLWIHVTNAEVHPNGPTTGT